MTSRKRQGEDLLAAKTKRRKKTERLSVIGKKLQDYPVMMKQYHEELNGCSRESAKDISASSAAAQSWWRCVESKCEGHCIHIWPVPFGHRTGTATGCPYCRHKSLCACELSALGFTSESTCWQCRQESNDGYREQRYFVCSTCLDALNWKPVLANMLKIAKNATKRKRKNRSEASTIDINSDFLKNMIHKQNFKCAISSHPLSFKKDSPFYPTVERISNAKGYVNDNVVIVCRLFQTMDQSTNAKKRRNNDNASVNDIKSAQWTLAKFEEATKLFGTTRAKEEREKIEGDIKQAKLKIVRRSTKPREIVFRNPKIFGNEKFRPENILKIACMSQNHSGGLLDPSEFTRSKGRPAPYGLIGKCRKCTNTERLLQVDTLIGRVRRLSNACQRYDGAKGFDKKTTVKPKELLKKYEDQMGCDFYTNLPMSIKSHSNWLMSVDKINRTQGHTNENTVLTCLEFNTRVPWTKEIASIVFGPKL
jgi:hypothetical protein